MSVSGSTRVARENARHAVARVAGIQEAKMAFEEVQAAVTALANAIDELDQKLDRIDKKK